MLVPLESQVTSLALSKRLAEAIGEAQTVWVWVCDGTYNDVTAKLEDTDTWHLATREFTKTANIVADISVETKSGCGCCSDWITGSRLAPAYTTSELLEWLRRQTEKTGAHAITISPFGDEWVVDLGYYEEIFCPTPAEALGELALKVKEGR